MTRTRRLEPGDLPSLAEMVADFGAQHPSATQDRSLGTLEDATLGARAVLNVVVAERGARLVGFVAWAPIFDLFWSNRGGRVDWLYVRPPARGHGVALQLVARAAADIRSGGGVFLMGTYGRALASEYESVVDGQVDQQEGWLTGDRFQGIASRADARVRDLVRLVRSSSASVP